MTETKKITAKEYKELILSKLDPMVLTVKDSFIKVTANPKNKEAFKMGVRHGEYWYEEVNHLYQKFYVTSNVDYVRVRNIMSQLSFEEFNL